MATYLHGAYGEFRGSGSRVSAQSRNAIVYVGTAPVHTIAGGAENVNKPILVQNIAEARAYFGYSDNWADYTLCEAMHVHFEIHGVGPLVLINVLDPAKHVSSSTGSKSLTPANGKVIIADAEEIVLDSVVVKAGGATKEKGTDYSIEYNYARKTITITELTSGALGTGALTITYNIIDASAVDEEAIIGSTDNAGLNTGLYAIRNVYQLCGYIPSHLLVPGFSSIPEVHAVMVAVSRKINGHWDAYMRTDLPLMDGEVPLTLANAKAWKDSHGYTAINETVYFPMAEGLDGAKYHLSVLAAANFQELLLEQEGIPYRTASNTNADVIANLYMGVSSAGRVYDDELINEKLNKHGIASAAYVGGRWAIWGAHSADYDEDNGDSINVAETNRMMLFYLSNDFQHRRRKDVDKPMTANDLSSIVSEEQSRLDALIKINALLYGEVHLTAEKIAQSDVYESDFVFAFNVTTTPLAKSLTALVSWTDEGFATIFENIG